MQKCLSACRTARPQAQHVPFSAATLAGLQPVTYSRGSSTTSSTPRRQGATRSSCAGCLPSAHGAPTSLRAGLAAPPPSRNQQRHASRLQAVPPSTPNPSDPVHPPTPPPPLAPQSQQPPTPSTATTPSGIFYSPTPPATAAPPAATAVGGPAAAGAPGSVTGTAPEGFGVAFSYGQATGGAPVTGSGAPGSNEMSPDTVIYMGGATGGGPNPLPGEAAAAVAAAPAVTGVGEGEAAGKGAGKDEARRTLEVLDTLLPPDRTTRLTSDSSPPAAPRTPLPPIISRVLAGKDFLGGGLLQPHPAPHHSLTELLKDVTDTAVEYEHKIQDYGHKAVGEVRSMGISAEEEAESVMHTLLHPRQAAAEWAARLMGRHSGLPGANPTPAAKPPHPAHEQQPVRSGVHNGHSGA